MLAQARCLASRPGSLQMAKRPRLAEDQGGELTDLLFEYFDVPTRVGKYTKACDAKSLKVHRKLLQGIQKLAPNFSVTPMMMKSCRVEAVSRKTGVWQFSGEDVEQFACDMGPRLRFMCRHVSQAMARKQQPGWLKLVLGEQKTVLEVFGARE